VADQKSSQPFSAAVVTVLDPAWFQPILLVAEAVFLGEEVVAVFCVVAGVGTWLLLLLLPWCLSWKSAVCLLYLAIWIPQYQPG
jgi:hypothetical protein